VPGTVGFSLEIWCLAPDKGWFLPRADDERLQSSRIPVAIKRIRQLGDPILREICRPVSLAEGLSVAADLSDTLHEFQRTHGFGRGIAAPQIGQAVRVIYLEFEGTSFTLINPRYLTQSEDRFSLWDDCFSFPELLVEVERHSQVEVQYDHSTGLNQSITATGALSELLQHEMDHLEGVLAIDRAIGRDRFRTREEHLRQTR
jgi:peptide deformylase